MPTIPTTESLWHLYRQSGDTRLRDRLASLNDRLALKIAHRMSAESPEPIEDLAQLCRIGLLKAIEKYDPEQGAAFSSFAVPYIRGEVQHWARDHGYSHLKVPRRTFEAVGSVKRTQKQLEGMGRTVTLDECAKAHGIDKEQWEWMIGAVQRKPLACIDDHQHLSADEDEELAEQQRDYNRLKQAIAQFPRLKRQLVEEFWFKGMAEPAIARRHKLTIEAVHNLLNEAFEQLKTQLLQEA